MMVLALQLAKPRCLHSYIQFIQRYTPRSKLGTEAGYLLTNLMSAVQFLETADESMLTISPREFERNLQKCRAISQEKMNVLTSSSTHSHAKLHVVTESNDKSSGSSPTYAEAFSPPTGRTRTLSFQDMSARKQRNADTEKLLRVTSETKLFTNLAEESQFMEALASANTDTSIRQIWARYVKKHSA